MNIYSEYVYICDYVYTSYVYIFNIIMNMYEIYLTAFRFQVKDESLAALGVGLGLPGRKKNALWCHP